MLKIYGSMLCPDCVACREELDAAGVAYEYLDFADSLKNLKEFLKLRDELAVFALGLFLGLTTADRFLGFLLTAAYTLLAAPIMYPVISAISNFGGDAWKE